jgi:hypothetical protein
VKFNPIWPLSGMLSVKGSCPTNSTLSAGGSVGSARNKALVGSAPKASIPTLIMIRIIIIAFLVDISFSLELNRLMQ